MLRLLKPHIEHLLDLLPRAGREYDLRAFDEDLFHLVDCRELEVRQFTRSEMLGEERREAEDIMRHIKPPASAVIEEVMVVSREMEISFHPCAPSETGPTGYFNDDMEFVPSPDYAPLPHYSSKTEDALSIRGLFSGRLVLEVCELEPPSALDAPDVEWEKNIRARLVTWGGELVAEHVDRSWSLAIVGVTLKALIAAPNMVAFNVVVLGE